MVDTVSDVRGPADRSDGARSRPRRRRPPAATGAQIVMLGPWPGRATRCLHATSLAGGLSEPRRAAPRREEEDDPLGGWDRAARPRRLPSVYQPRSEEPSNASPN